MFSGNSFIVYVVLAAIAIVAVVTIVIPPLLDVSGDWTLTRAMNVLREYGYTAFADTEGNLSARALLNLCSLARLTILHHDLNLLKTYLKTPVIRPPSS